MEESTDRFAQKTWRSELYRRFSMITMIVHTLIIPASIVLLMIVAALPVFWPLLALYVAIMFLDSRSENGMPLNRYQTWCRKCWWWKAFAYYYPVTVHKTVDLAPSAAPQLSNSILRNAAPWSWPDFPPLFIIWPVVITVKVLWRLAAWRLVGWRVIGSSKTTLTPDPNARKYLFGVSPHGIISMGAFAGIATDGANWSQIFPGIDVRLLTLGPNFYFPFWRQYLLATGMGSVSKQSCINMLSNNQNIAIVLGGADESLLAEPGEFNLILKRRYGFAKVALQTGATLVPVLSFGENDIYEQTKFPPGSWGDRFHSFTTKYLGFTLPLFHARGIFNKEEGLFPYRRPINIVVGAPIDVPYTPNPSRELVQQYHDIYIAHVKELFAQHVEKYSPGVELHIVG